MGNLSRVLTLLVLGFAVVALEAFQPRGWSKAVQSLSRKQSATLSSAVAVETHTAKPFAELRTASHCVTLDKKSDPSSVLHLQVSGSPSASVRVIQRPVGPVPRAQYPAALLVDASSAPLESETAFFLLEEGLRWYLDNGGRVKQLLAFTADPVALEALQTMGFDLAVPLRDLSSEQRELHASLALPRHAEEGVVAWAAQPQRLIDHCRQRLAEGKGLPHSLHDIIGRLSHDIGNPREAIEAYTKALMANNASAVAFRNLGSAYQAIGHMPMAFASFQQAVQLDPSDGITYLKLAYFYEDFARQDWDDAEVHSEKCYRHYLETVDGQDTAVLMRLANLLMRENQAEKALQVYDEVLRVDEKVVAACFNKAQAALKLSRHAEAKECLERALRLDGSLLAAKHMLQALDPVSAAQVSAMDPHYVIDLFNGYAPSYDDHMKKLFYTAPRVLRQELAATFRQLGRGIEDIAPNAIPAPPPPGGHCSSYTSFMNHTLDVLDLGCGTGQAGSWLKDYARRLVGVDLSPEMVKKAEKKKVFDELHVQDMVDYLEQGGAGGGGESFDLVVAAEALSYLGELDAVFRGVAKRVRPEGIFAFTLESLKESHTTKEEEEEDEQFKLLVNGRFGHSNGYLAKLIEESGFSRVLKARDFSPRLENGEAVHGYLYILQK
eukprot:gene8459-9325_t